MAAPRKRLVPALLWLLSVALICRMTIFIRQRTATEFTAVDTNAAAEIAIVGLTMAVLLLVPRLGQVWRAVSRTSFALLLAYYGLCTASALWSPALEFSLFRGAEAGCEYFAVLVALSYCVGFVDAEKRVLTIALLAMVLGLAATLKLNKFDFSIDGLHTNSYTASAAVLCCYCLGELIASASGRRARTLKIFGLAGLAGVVMGTSSASIIAALCGGAVAFLLSRQRGILLSVLIVVVVSVVFLLEGDELASVIFPGKTEEQIYTLHGRTLLWESYFEDIKDHPIVGMGFGVGSRLSTFRYTTNAHNAVMAVLLGTGIAGMLIVLGAAARLGREVLGAVRLHRRGGAGCAAALTAAVVNSMGLPIVGETWMVPTLPVACVLALLLLFVVRGDPAAAVTRDRGGASGSRRVREAAG